jgi:RecA/RadA recombinase
MSVFGELGDGFRHVRSSAVFYPPEGRHVAAAEYDAAITDLERIIRGERARVLVIGHTLPAIPFAYLSLAEYLVASKKLDAVILVIATACKTDVGVFSKAGIYVTKDDGVSVLSAYNFVTREFLSSRVAYCAQGV